MKSYNTVNLIHQYCNYRKIYFAKHPLCYLNENFKLFAQNFSTCSALTVNSPDVFDNADHHKSPFIVYVNINNNKLCNNYLKLISSIIVETIL